MDTPTKHDEPGARVVAEPGQLQGIPAANRNTVTSGQTAEELSASRLERTPTRAFWAIVCVVVYVGTIGVFAIEQINQRKEMLASIQARRIDLLQQIATVGSKPTGPELIRDLTDSLTRIQGLQSRLTGLITVGAMTHDGTLPKLACELIQLDDSTRHCEDPRYGLARQLLSGEMIEFTANGPLLAFLVIFAGLAGGAIQLSLDEERPCGQRRWRLIRSLGGGLVCYVALRAGTLPFSLLVESSLTVDPARWSLFGLLAGMFANQVLELLSAVAKSTLSKLAAAFS